jgi:hypothetical protein
MSTNQVNEEALDDACKEFQEGRRGPRWTHRSQDKRLDVGVSLKRV